MHDPRASDMTPGAVHYTMKTKHTPRPQSGASSSHSHSHSRSGSHSLRQGTTPAASPRIPYSVGQQFPPKLSPGRVPDIPAPSPNYFSLTIEPLDSPRDSTSVPRENWSPPTSSVKSFAAALPRHVPLETNPEFEAFKNAIDQNARNRISLPNSRPLRPRPPRWNTHGNDTASERSVPMIRSTTGVKEKPTNKMDVDQDSLHDSAYVSGESKRSSEASLNPPMFFNAMRHESPAQVESPFERRTAISRVDDRHPRLSVMPNKADPPSPDPHKRPRSETMQPNLESGPLWLSPEQLKNVMDGAGNSDLLLLDIRGSQHYSQSRIRGALNLCIPTTLLKRPMYNLEKLQGTFHDPRDQDRFSRWQGAKYIVVYDSFSSERRDAVALTNMLKKFTNEAYTGNTCILRGGINVFSEAHPDMIDDSTGPNIGVAPSFLARQAGSKPDVPLVIGGVALPNAAGTANPFFANIRQNESLVDGVGRMDVARPYGVESPMLPQWLRDASAVQDHGKKVSDKFLCIETDEQARMKAAYSTFGPDAKVHGDKPQLCGIEKGGKNRYKDILPFEQTRVKLLGRPEGDCDYFNASHIKASRSNKRYIATQGPLPSTFDDFWSVIWDRDVRVIVMLTAESEGGQLKCHPYWEAGEYGPLKLRTISEKKISLDLDKHRSNSTIHFESSSASSSESSRRRANTTTTIEGSAPTPQAAPGQGETPYVILRKLALTHVTHPFEPIREITHLHYPSWPDFGAPAQPSHLLALVELANIMQRSAMPLHTPSLTGPRPGPVPLPVQPAVHPAALLDLPEEDPHARPMLVHCSAGCGRTGAFCTVDSVLDMLKRQRTANMASLYRDDAEGDIEMTDSISPRTSVADMQFLTPAARRRSPVIEARRGSGGLPVVDTAFMNDESLDLIEKTVEDFRQQRLSMVQSLRQFVLCYETVLEWLWRIQGRSGVGAPERGRARSGSLQVRRGS